MTLPSRVSEPLAKGWAVFPCRPRGKEPLGRLARNGYKSATVKPSTAERLWGVAPEANVGISCEGSGLLVVDVDERNGGDAEEILDWLSAGSLTTIRSYTVRTANGWHFYYRAPRGLDRCPAKLRPGVDLKWRGYVLGAGSVHPSGARYEIADSAPVAECPAPLRAWLGLP